MSDYSTHSDDYYVNVNLATELELNQSRESVLHFFEQVRRRYTAMEHFYTRENNEIILEEDKDSGDYRWVSIEPKRVNSGVVNPQSFEDAVVQHRSVMELVPYDLSITGLDCESLSVSLGFDFSYRGNHNEVLAKAIGVPTGLDKFAGLSYGPILSHEPAFQFALDEECRTQCRISFESRTGAYQIRSGEFGDDHLSVYLTVRRFGSLPLGGSFAEELERLAGLCRDLTDEHLVSSVLQPLQEAISIQ